MSTCKASEQHLNELRDRFRLFCKFKSHNRGGRPKLYTETVALIRQMAQQNRLWGAEHVRGELQSPVLRSPSTPFRNI